MPANLIAMLRQASTCYLATTMPDGSPQLTQTWVDTDGVHVLINTVQGSQKARNIERDRRVALTISDPANPSRYHAVRGQVVNVTNGPPIPSAIRLSTRARGSLMTRPAAVCIAKIEPWIFSADDPNPRWPDS